MKDITVANDPDFSISLVFKYSFPFLSCSDTQHKFGNDDTGSICDAVVAMHACIANNLKCGSFIAKSQISGSRIVLDTVCDMNMLIISTKMSIISSETHSDVPLSKSRSKFDARLRSCDCSTALPSALPPITRKRMFHGSSESRDGGSIPEP